MTERINRILEVDIDTDRKENVIVRIVSESQLRPEGGLQTNYSPKIDTMVFATALMASIIQAEEEDPSMKGKIMKSTIDYMNEIYASTEVETRKLDVNENNGQIEEE